MSNEATDRPTGRPDDDPRFTTGLALDVARVLYTHGYRWPDGDQLVDLQTCLFGYLYRDGGIGCVDGAR